MDKNSATLDPDADTAMRFNQGKTRYGLLPTSWTKALAEVMTRGAVKYRPDNWKKGMDPSFMVDSLERHLQSFREGEIFDPESGNHHMAHVAWNALALMYYEREGMVPNDWYENKVNTSVTEQLGEPIFEGERDFVFANPQRTIVYWTNKDTIRGIATQYGWRNDTELSTDYPGAWCLSCRAQRAHLKEYPQLMDVIPSYSKAEWAAMQEKRKKKRDAGLD